MWDEEINKKIKDAADQYHPAYDDSAWDNMEQMLNEHLPLKKDRRRIIYFLPLILLLGGITFFIVSRKETMSSSKISEKPTLKINPGKSQYKHQNSPSDNSSPDKSVSNSTTLKSGKNLTDVKRDDLSKETSINAVNRRTKKTGTLSAQQNAIASRNAQPTSKNPLPNGQEKQSEDRLSAKVNADENNSNKNNSTNETILQKGKPSNEDIVPTVIAGNNNPLQKVSTATIKNDKKTPEPNDVAKPENPKDSKSNIKPKKTKKTFIQNFGIGLSIGPDISAVRLSNTGKITPAYGAGLSYSFTDKITLRAGFYIAKKIYSVDEDEYHVQPGSTWNNYLQSVDANCKVYEVPVTLSYNFGKTKNHNWFASAGLSSYFMKKEAYVYYYKNPAGATWSSPWSVKNQNKHYFSVLDVSGGYEYSINKRFSLMAEPYIKLPLTGIGAGKIKLNSAGILFTITVKPF